MKQVPTALALSLLVCCNGDDGSANQPSGDEGTLNDPAPPTAPSGVPQLPPGDAGTPVAAPTPPAPGPNSTNASPPGGSPSGADAGATVSPMEPEAAPSLEPNADPDGDGLTNSVELQLGTAPLRYDSDNDGIGDAQEVGNPESPLDEDSDGIIDALERDNTDNDLDGIEDPEDPTSGWQLVFGAFEPAVVANDGQSSARLEVHLVNLPAGASVRAGMSPSARTQGAAHYDLKLDGSSIGTMPFELFDDGTHGDVMAGDSVYSRAGLTTEAPIREDNGVRGAVSINALYINESGVEEEHLIATRNSAGRRRTLGSGFTLHVVEQSARVQVTQHRPGVRRSAHLLNIVAAEHAMTSRSLLSRGGLQAMIDMVEAAQSELAESIDLVYFFPLRPALTNVSGIYFPLSNDVQGIGRTVSPGPGPQLGDTQGLVVLSPAPGVPITHETGHRWGVKIGLGLSNDGSHWGLVAADGVLGGFPPSALNDLGGGVFQLTRASALPDRPQRFSDLELYLMGLMPPEEVAPVSVVSDYTITDSSNPTYLTLNATLRTVSVDDIVAEHGPRLPAFGDAPTEFRSAFVVFSTRALTVSEMSFFDHHASSFGAPESIGSTTFEEATGGRAQMDTSLPALRAP